MRARGDEGARGEGGGRHSKRSRHGGWVREWEGNVDWMAPSALWRMGSVRCRDRVWTAPSTGWLPAPFAPARGSRPLRGGKGGQIQRGGGRLGAGDRGSQMAEGVR